MGGTVSRASSGRLRTHTTPRPRRGWGLTPKFSIKVDRADVVLARELVEHRGDDRPDVVLVVAEIVEEGLQRGPGHLQLRGRELEPVRDLVGADQVGNFARHVFTLPARGYARQSCGVSRSRSRWRSWPH